MSDLMHMAKNLKEIAEKQAVVDAELNMLKEEREEVESYLTGRIAVLEELLEQKESRLRDEYSQHMRYNKYKLIVEADIGAEKTETLKDWKKKSYSAAKPLWLKFVEQQQEETKQRAAEDATEKAAHEARMKKIRDDGMKHVNSIASSADKPKGARKKADPKEKKDAKPRPKTAQQLFCWEEETQKAYRKAKEEYKAAARKLREEAGLQPVVPRATPRAKPKEAGSKKQATLQGIVKRKSKEAKVDKKKNGKRASDSDDDDDEEEEVVDDGEDSDVAIAKEKPADPSDDEEEEKEEEEEEKEGANSDDDDDDAPPAKKKKKKGGEEEPAAAVPQAPAEAAGGDSDSSSDE